jgi:uncharacterized cupredoxin-like copper-binding protein
VLAGELVSVPGVLVVLVGAVCGFGWAAHHPEHGDAAAAHEPVAEGRGGQQEDDVEDGGVVPLDRCLGHLGVPSGRDEAEPAGKVSLVAANMGWRTHELVILPLSAGESAGQRDSWPDGKVDEAESLGEASASCGAGAGDGIRAGTVSWTTLTLAPGRYELVCNLPNHYADGMHQEILVTSS